MSLTTTEEGAAARAAEEARAAKEAAQKAEADQKAAEQVAGKRLLPV